MHFIILDVEDGWIWQLVNSSGEMLAESPVHFPDPDAAAAAVALLQDVVGSVPIPGESENLGELSIPGSDSWIAEQSGPRGAGRDDPGARFPARYPLDIVALAVTYCTVRGRADVPGDNERDRQLSYVAGWAAAAFADTDLLSSAITDYSTLLRNRDAMLRRRHDPSAD